MYKAGHSEQFVPAPGTPQKTSTVPLPIRKKIPWNTEDLTGHVKGELTVIGMYAGPEVGIRPKDRHRSKSKDHGWVCRCSCGNYTVRKAKSLKKPIYEEETNEY